MTGSKHFRGCAAAIFLTSCAGLSATELEVHPTNRRWLTNDGGESALVLTGAHTWSIFQDYELGPSFDALEYLSELRDQGHNFTRGWFWEDAYYSPLPYEREGGLYRLSPPYSRDYAKRLRSRVRAAASRGLYVSVMLFQGWSMDDRGGLRRPGPWPENPYNRANTRERVSKQQGALHIGVAQQQQLDYVSFVAGKLCSESNVVWEISNEVHPNSLGTPQASSWKRNVVNHLAQECDRGLIWVSCPLPDGLTAQQRTALNDGLLALEADLVSPCEVDGAWVSDPPPADGRRVLVADSDHLGLVVDATWVWRAFLRGQHPVFMDLTQDLAWWEGERWDPEDPRWSEVRLALGSVQEMVALVNRNRGSSPSSGLAEMAPQPGRGGAPGQRARPATSAFTLFSADKPCKGRAGRKCGKARANGDEFLVLAGPSETVRVCRLAAHEPYRFRWKKIARPGFVAPGERAVADSTGCLEFENPTETGVVLHLERWLESPAGAA